jgi:ketosteroid isomerase-like protein
MSRGSPPAAVSLPAATDGLAGEPGIMPGGVSRQNVDTVRAILEAFNRGDMRRVAEMCDPEIEWDLSRRLVDPETYHGHEGIQKFYEQQLEVWEKVPWMEAEDLIDAGDQVVAFVRVHGRGKGSGAAVDARIAQVWTIRGKRATRLEYYGDRTEALNAVGMG